MTAALDGAPHTSRLLETTPLEHTYGAPYIKTEPTVTAGMPGLARTLNISLAGENFGARGEVLRFDGWCNNTADEVCGRTDV